MVEDTIDLQFAIFGKQFGSSKIEMVDHNLFDLTKKVVWQAICFPNFEQFIGSETKF
jgi:hypothetical protein